MIRYTHDTRTLEPGDYYVAIRGERYDGHTFIPNALEQGAAGLVIDRDLATLPGLSNLSVPTHIDIIRVDDCTTYLAREARRRLETLGCDVVAITGSVGKTTTKKAIVNVLQQAYAVVTPRGNWNTLLGLSLTVLNELTHSDQKFVTEIGIYHAGEITEVCTYIRPRVAVVVNVRGVHLETMGTIENIARAKGELVECLPSDGYACLNYDDPRVRAMQDRCQGRVRSYGIDQAADVRPERITTEIPLLGDYKTHIALAAIAVADCFDMPDELVQQGLAQIQSDKGRLYKLPGIHDTVLIDDTYNASLSSSLAALEVLRQYDGDGPRRIAMLGDMLELGSEEESSHQIVVTWALEVADLVLLVGPRFWHAVTQLNAHSPDRLFTFADVHAALEALQEEPIYQAMPGDVVLFKGSAGMRMERLVELFLSPELAARDVLVRQEAHWR